MQVGNYYINDNTLLLHAISGSRAYGLDTSQSDTDYKGVFILPKGKFYGLETNEQVSNESNDIVFYELKRFFELLLKNNPNILELLATPDDCIIYKHPLYDLLRPKQFLSKLCRQTFVLYAESQIKKARGLNKKIVNPVDRERKTIENFCYVVKSQGTIPLREWLKNAGFRQEECGLVALPHMRDMYVVFHNSQAAGLSLRGIYSGMDANDVQLSSIPKGLAPLAIMTFNKDGYSTYCREYKEYWDWVGKRNENRYQNTLTHGKNYDAKNMMHVFRLLNMAEDIAVKGEIIVRRPERDFLLAIKNGEYEYDYLLNTALDKITFISDLFNNSALPDEPDYPSINRLLAETRESFYNKSL